MMNDRVLTTSSIHDSRPRPNHEMQTILREIKRWCKWVREHRLQTFVIITDETPLELRNRLFDVIVGKTGIGGLYCFTAPDDLVGNYAELEGLRYHISCARLEKCCGNCRIPAWLIVISTIAWR